ncbi:PREDICTED: mas-related G-protein coupled receptor member X2-like [Propithecus coquereli]|uniref:mas-related G-protein coupled receptor member X2-like n=1 Tax=Propithecus coquereli TaxID=379532 RepID=UPI00063F49D0|nr:PREDICTED: mas-related G-protein coupled receptor member X2-like [Propithecus coquereli]
MDPTIPWATEITTMNGNDQIFSPSCDKKTLILVFLIVVIALVGLLGNGVVLWLLGFRMRRNAFSVYILNLAGADFLLLCFQIINYLGNLIDVFHSVSISIPNFFITVSTFAYLAGLSLLSAISAERCLSVLWPVWYRCRRPRHLSSVTCALLWALSLFLSTLEGKFCGFLFRIGDYDWCRTFDFITAAWLIVLFVALAGTSLALLLRILCGSQRMPLTRLYVTVVFTVLAFLLCGLPYGIYWFLLIWMDNSFNVATCYLYLVVDVLSCANCSTNPIIYFFVGSFRQRWRQRGRTLRLVLQRALQDTPEGDDSEGSFPQGPLEMSGSSLG